MLNLLRKSLKLELHKFYEKIEKRYQEVTASAFVQNRHKIKPALFQDINKLIAKEYYLDNDANVKLYKGLRILAIDGSTVHLPVSESTTKHYGSFKNQKVHDDIVMGRVSVLYDVLNDIVLDGLLTGCSIGEVTLGRQHLQHTGANDLILYDRAYPSFYTAFLMREQKVDFLFRCKKDFNNLTKTFAESNKKDWVTEWTLAQDKSYKDLPYTKEEKMKVRLVKVKLDSGETEILMTSLIDKRRYLKKDFKQLYFKRWGIETFYDRLKNLIEVERFSGTKHMFIQQEFYCALYASNMQTIFTTDIEIEEQLKIKYQHRKYVYKVNQSISLGFIRDKMIDIFFGDRKTSEERITQLKQLFILTVVPIRPNRKFDREHKKYKKRTKPMQFSNKRLIQ